MQNFACTNHFNDSFLPGYIRRNGELGNCSYCKSNRLRKVIALDDLAEFIENRIWDYYADAASWLPYETKEGGYQGVTYDLQDIFDRHDIEVDLDVFQDLDYLIEDIAWCERDPFGDKEHELWLYSWKNFKNVVSYKQRFTFFYATVENRFSRKEKVAQILTDIGKLIVQYSMFSSIDEQQVLYRCRQHKSLDSVKMLEDICTPQSKYIRYSNRMSPARIGMLYTAFNLQTVKDETLSYSDASQPYFTIAQLAVKNQINLIDLSSLPGIPSIFNRGKQKHYSALIFLHNFISDISQPVNRELGVDPIEYIPTQAVIEYFRFLFPKYFKRKVDGLIYPSAVAKGNNCIVIFWDHDYSKEHLKLIKLSAKKIHRSG